MIRNTFFWFLVGAAVVAFSLIAFELVRHIGSLGDIAMLAMIMFGPGYFLAGIGLGNVEPMMIYVAGTFLNGTIYACLSWIVSKVPARLRWARPVIIVLPFLPLWGLFFYDEFLAK